jgi:Flp pilus assembly pilin Flp
MIARFMERFYKEEDGQGITEYGAIIAFVSVLVFFVFTFANGTLSQSLQQCSSSMIGQLNRINNAVIAVSGT